MDAGNSKTRWLRDLIRFLPLKSQFVLSGNVRDLQIAQSASGATPQPLLQHLAGELRAYGYQAVLTYEPVHGFRLLRQPGEAGVASQALMSELGVQEGAPAALDAFADVLEHVVAYHNRPVALIVDFASRMVVRNDVLSQAEHSAFTKALVASHSPAARPRPFGDPPRPFTNAVIWVVEKEGDLPDWMLVGNPRIRHIPVARPDQAARRMLAASLMRGLEGYAGANAKDQEAAVQAFVDDTEGLLLLDVQSIVQLGRSEAVSFNKIADAVRRYKVGVTEDPWSKIDRSKILNAQAFVTRRVKGQDHAVMHMLDIVKRAVVGFGGSRRHGRPRGVVFLAGPTGVGKTELAKTITTLLFGDETAYIRFDMSEFSAEHSDQRLIGAPPGYVGYDVGGELTNAIREKPFSVVLFDEIEKAHPRILDKFLQVLDDGVLTSGRGDRVYFSEALIIFTSNLGIYRVTADGERVPNALMTDSLTTIQAKVMAEIDSHFKVTLNRPELLNRIGDNVIVFDFIREAVAGQIFDDMVSAVFRDMREHRGIAISIAKQAETTLRQACLADLSNGGRGIRNKIEALLINPLARALFEVGGGSGDRFEIAALDSGQINAIRLQKH